MDPRGRPGRSRGLDQRKITEAAVERQFRALLLTHRDAAALLRERPPRRPHRLGYIETTVRILLSAGFSDDEAAGIARLLAAHVLGSTPGIPRDVPELPAELFPHLARVAPAYGRLSEQDTFELGVEIILDGLVRRPDVSDR